MYVGLYYSGEERKFTRVKSSWWFRSGLDRKYLYKSTRSQLEGDMAENPFPNRSKYVFFHIVNYTIFDVTSLTWNPCIRVLTLPFRN